ncbi:hypothetical protein E3J62_05345 [candidate division TA06 bacterium]|uniref:Uncharacterized protein n=1 Tax=candidate division TA06 bacterium TaxID=2250710 RepID=A0A523UU79_UNCT6|nr:MAG: hypothetical protein E3J62_05345 [candidate division TA06 bacterium]
MRKIVAALAAAGLLVFFLGCQIPGGENLVKIADMEKSIAELNAKVDALTESVDELASNFDELSKSYAEHLEKHHKKTTYKPPPKKIPRKIK